jgi:autotransporter-associated beta strand protein
MTVDTYGFDSTFSGLYSGQGGLTKIGIGTLILSGSDSYSGGTILSEGTLQLGNTFALGAATGSLAVNSGVLDLHGYSPTVGSLSGSALIATLTSGVSTLTVSGTASTTYAGILNDGAGQLALTKSGAGTLTLTGASTNTGATAVLGGGLALKTTSAGTASLGNTAITVGAGATFYATLGASPASTVVNAGTTGTGSAGATLTLNPGSALSMVDGAIGTFNLQQENSFVGAGLVIGGTSGAAPTLAYEIGNGGTGTDQIDVTKDALVLATGGRITIDALAGDTSLTAGNYDLINGLSLSGTTVALDGTTYRLSLAGSTTTAEVLSVSLGGTPESRAALEGSGGLASSPEGVPATAGISAPRDLASGPIGTAAVPEPENWASGIAALASVGLLAGRWRMRKGS